MAKREHLQALLALPRIAEHWRQAHGHAPNEDTIDRIYEAFLATQSRVIADSGELIPGCLATMDHCRQRGLKLGSSTGYTKALMELLVPVARRQGLEFDAMVCADDVPQGRPAPWMCLENAKRLDVFPMASIVVVDDTTVGVNAGLNSGMWTAGVVQSGNLVGLSEAELKALDPAERSARIDAASQTLVNAGTHFVIPSVAELPAALDKIERLQRDRSNV
jgi:phosphonoacetaldehyde hydrolase